MQSTPPLTIEHLPAVRPDLVALGNGSRWRIERCSARLAGQLAGDPESLRGRDLSILFAGSQPSLVELLREVVEKDALLSGVVLRLPAGETVNLALEPLGLSDDYSGYRVALFLQQHEAEPHRETFGLIGSSPAIRDVLRKIERYGPTEAAVVVTGETGTGKELVAAALHRASERCDGPLVAVNCAAISSELLESELFGHEKGAFTGAIRSHRGRFERADGGTLFLDEVGDMPAEIQAKLLRVLETGCIERVGAEREQRVDVRVVCATNVPLEQAVGEGRFRADLYHRLAVLRIHLPPLRERIEDIPPLVDHFLRSFSKKYRRRIERLTPEAISLLQAYLWPGNIRELRNVLERVFIETRAEVIGARAFAEWVRERQAFAAGGQSRSEAPIVPPYPLPQTERLLEAPAELSSRDRHSRSTCPVGLTREMIREALDYHRGNLSAAARRLGVHRATLYRYLKKLGIQR
ncbi:sigma-54-dependent Fis family transcriptional regulator [Geothermobacter hydrogeniphilus]|uniref:Sigma-54-dependent Fis family transcriptional regulator n=1 Tax=Geothermobacter hydrogeniphilus TaxID=1969733 RepID=A0A2K2HAC9_9BACT|nr:sigma-54-dependent Fis family transcriptional regulator [Geothermobacter hydrogeniphilus]